MLYKKQIHGISEDDNIVDIKHDSFNLSNGLDVYHINKPNQDLVKIEFLFYAGSFFQPKKLISALTTSMLREGTRNKTSAEIAQIMDYYGTHINFEPQKDFISISLFVLEKFIEPVCILLEEILKEAVFPEDELEKLLENLKKQHIVNMEKVINIARMNFSSLIFGEDHPYGRLLKLSDFENVGKNDLCDFHKKYINASNSFCIIAGGSSGKIIPVIEKCFGQNDWTGSSLKNYQYENVKLPKPEKKFIHKPKVVQSAIRIGKVCPGINHPDYNLLIIANFVLGGFFGSRLMKKIRQEKGYTYGINSSVVSLINSAYFFISTQVGVDVCKPALNEIYKEIELLRKETISKEELDMVKNYLYGTLLRSFDGVFAQADRLKELVAFKLNNSYFVNLKNTLKEINGDDISEMLNMYLNENSMSELVVGEKAL